MTASQSRFASVAAENQSRLRPQLVEKGVSKCGAVHAPLLRIVFWCGRQRSWVTGGTQEGGERFLQLVVPRGPGRRDEPVRGAENEILEDSIELLVRSNEGVRNCYHLMQYQRSISMNRCVCVKMSDSNYTTIGRSL